MHKKKNNDSVILLKSLFGLVIMLLTVYLQYNHLSQQVIEQSNGFINHSN